VYDVVDGLNKPTVSETSKVGILSSSRFLDLIKPFIEDDTRAQYHRMLYAISLVYTHPAVTDMQQLTIPKMLQVGSMAGHNFLKILDRLLKSQHLRSCSRDQVRSVFLLIFGSILAVGYMEPPPSAPENLARFKNTQDFLCPILAPTSFTLVRN
jgi:hypothetical protein